MFVLKKLVKRAANKKDDAADAKKESGKYQPMKVDEWNTIPNDDLPHKECWDGPKAFEPDQFSKNTQKAEKWNDIYWAIAFYIQFAISIIFAIVLVFQAYEKNKGAVKNYRNQDFRADQLFEEISSHKRQIWMCIGCIVGVSIVANLFHMAFAVSLPGIYVLLGIWLPLIVGIVLFLGFSIYTNEAYWQFLLLGIGSCISFIIHRRYIKFSTVLFKNTMRLIVRYPSLCLVTLLQIGASILINFLFSVIAYGIYYLEYPSFLYVFVVFSFYWTNSTYYYVTYMTGAGLASSYYFLKGTEYFPKYPVISAYKRALTTSFGTASLAGLILSLVRTVEWLSERTKKDDDDDDRKSINFFTIVVFILQIILWIIRKFVEELNKFGLIYSATFNISYANGCKRYREMSWKKYIDIILNSSVISTSLTWNRLMLDVVVVALSAFTAIIFGFEDWIVIAIFAIISYNINNAICNILIAPIDVISDTLMICFTEHPEKMKTVAKGMYNECVELYDSELAAKIEKQNKKK